MSMKSSIILRRLSGLAVVLCSVGLVSCLEKTPYWKVPAPTGAHWGMERDTLSSSTMTSSSHQEVSSYDNKTYNVYVRRMSQTLGDHYDADRTQKAIKARCPKPGVGECAPPKGAFKPLEVLPK